MVLRYMVSDTDLAKGRISPPEERPTGLSKRPPVLRRRLWLLLLLLANMISWTVVYGLWTGDRQPILKLLELDRARVTGIMCDAQNPGAIVCDRVVHEGDTINGYKVVKIYEDKVDFERNGKVVTRHLR